MDIQQKRNHLIKEISKIESFDILTELEKSLGRILFQERMNSQGESITTESGNEFMTNEEAIKLLEDQNEITLRGQETKENSYRNKLIEAVNYLSDCEGEIFTKMLNVAMSGEFKEIDEVFEEGDIYEFDIEQFRNSKDLNVEKLVALHDHINETIESIINLNAIDLEDID